LESEEREHEQQRPGAVLFDEARDRRERRGHEPIIAFGAFASGSAIRLRLISVGTDAESRILGEHGRRREDSMHMVMLSLVVAFLLCTLLLAAFGLFTTTPFAHRIDDRVRRDASGLTK